jgi:hypothetical protein
VLALESFDDGTGAALYAAGRFDSAGGASAHGIARWDGANWSALGSGMAHSAGSPTVAALAVFDSGNGPHLCAGGNFDSAGGIASAGLAQWDGASWSDLGLGAGAYVPQENWIRELCVADDGSAGGPALIVAGDFSAATGSDAFPRQVGPADRLHAARHALLLARERARDRLPLQQSAVRRAARLRQQLRHRRRAARRDGRRLAVERPRAVHDLGETPSATSIVRQGTSASASGAVFRTGMCAASRVR